MISLEDLNQGKLRSLLLSLIEEVVKEKLAEFVVEHEKKAKDISIMERLLRLEEELKALRELEERRFEALLREMNARFEAMNTRFEALQKEINTRFEALQKEMNTRFEAMNSRFEALERRFNFLQWLIIGGFSFLGILLTLIKLGY
ncbi:MAG: hypothetical protein NZ530_03835 [Thermodesulfobacteriaceae bacterium]|nr:hypothetical protein [Thermodesulfobacteriaceae bacterium]